MSAARLGLCLTVLCLLFPARAWGADVARFALVIGSNRAETSASDRLRYADDDAIATHQLLVDAGVQSLLLVAPDEPTRRLNASLRPDGVPRIADIERSFARLAVAIQQVAQRGRPTELLLFFSGHGDVDGGEGYVILQDARWTRSALFALLKRSPAHHNHVVVDACKSYFLVFPRGPGGRRTPYSGALLADAVPAQLGNTGFILSSSSDRDSHEWERYQGGILSHQLRSALRGAADVDLDRRISYAELGAFLTTANASIDNLRFRPEFVVRPPEKQLEHALLTWDAERTGTALESSGWGHFYVENARGQRLLDAHPAASQRLALWLPDERPLFVRRHDDRAEQVLATNEQAWIGAPLPNNPELARRGALNLALESLFATPFGPEHVERFKRDALFWERARERRAPARDRLATLRTSALLTAGVAGAAGLTLSGLAGIQSLQARDGTQVEVRSANERIADLHRASIPAYTIAGVATLTWALTLIWRDAPVALAPAVSARDGSGGLSFGGTF